MNKDIPYVYTAPKPFFALSLKATKLHSALKHINKCLYILANNSSNNLTKVNHHLSKAATLAEIEIPSLTQSQLNSSSFDLITQIKHYKHIIWQARNFEKKQEQSERIKFYTNRRYTDFKDNTSRMLDSILKRRVEPVNFEKIILPDKIITDKHEIKETTHLYFKN